MREEVIGSARLILADCRDVLPTLDGLASIITDPVWPNVPPDSVPGSDRPWELWRETCDLMPATKRIVVVMRCDSDPRFLSAVQSLPFFRVMVLPYVMPGYLGRVLGGDEFAYWFGEPVARVPGRMVIPGRGPAVQPGGRKANGHPMSRAQEHFDWLVSWASDDGEVVCDPFMGSGTTGCAAARWGRPFVGIEVHEPYFDIACRRVEKAQKQGDLFVETAA